MMSDVHTTPNSLSLQVGGNHSFPESRWRECLLAFLFGVWSNDRKVTARPKIDLGGITLSLDLEGGEYRAYRRSDIPECAAPAFSDDQTLEVGSSSFQVETALVRFVKNDAVRLLIINLGRGQLMLWKMPQRSRLGVACQGLPTMRELLGIA